MGREVSQRAAVNVVVRGTAEILGKVATLAWTVLAARLLTQHEFGAVSYALTLSLVVGSVPSGGFNQGLVRRGSADPDHLSRYYSENVIWKTVLGVPAVLVAAVLTRDAQQTAATAVVIWAFLLSTFPEAWSNSVRSASSARQRPGASSTALVVQRLVTAAAIAVALLLHQGAAGVAVGFLVGTTVGWLVHLRAARALEAEFRPGEVSRRDLKEVLSETWVVGVSAVVLMLLFRVDALMLEALAGLTPLAHYTAAYRLLETVLFVTFAINQAIFPVMSAATSPDQIRRGFERGLAVAGFVYLPFAAVCLVDGQGIVRLLYGDDYVRSSSEILAWLTPSPLLYAVAFFGSSVLMARKQPAGMLTAAVVATGVNVGLNLWLIPAHVGVGAAVATSVSYGVYALVIHLFLRRTVSSVALLRPLREVALASLVLAGVLWVLPLPLLVELVLGGITFLGTWLSLARRWAPEQVEVVQGLVRR